MIFNYIVFESNFDGLGHLLGSYSKVEYAVEAAKKYLDSPVLYIGGDIITYSQVAYELNKLENTVLLTATSNDVSGCIIFKIEVDKNYFNLDESG